MKDFFLVSGGVVSAIAVIPYIRGIIANKTKPNIVSWGTWAMLSSIATFAAFFDGEVRTAVFSATFALANIIITFLSLSKGYFKLEQFDIICLCCALFGLLLWWAFSSPLLALISVVAVDFTVCLPTIRHAWKKPSEENLITFILGGVASIVALFSLNEYNLVSLLYPLNIFLTNLLIVYAILSRKKRLNAK